MSRDGLSTVAIRSCLVATFFVLMTVPASAQSCDLTGTWTGILYTASSQLRATWQLTQDHALAFGGTGTANITGIQSRNGSGTFRVLGQLDTPDDNGGFNSKWVVWFQVDSDVYSGDLSRDCNHFTYTAMCIDLGSPYQCGPFTVTGNPTIGGFTGDRSATALKILTTTLLAGTLSKPYSQTLTASGGKAPYTWSVISGALPGALTLNPATGAISGTPTAAGVFDFTVQVTDSAAATATQAFSIQISGASQSLQLVFPATAGPSLSNYTCGGSAAGVASCKKGTQTDIVVIATLLDTNKQPVSGEVILFKEVVGDFTSSGHNHDSSTWPFSAWEAKCTTGATLAGQCQVMYPVREVSGVSLITGEMQSNSTVTDAHPFTAAVQGIANSELPEVTNYFFLSGQPGRQNQPSQHNHNHYGTKFLLDSVATVAIQFGKSTEGLFGARQMLGVNDMSLISGGIFDINNNWIQNPGHHLHRNGNSVDVDGSASVDSAIYNPTVSLKGPSGNLPLLKTLFCHRNMFQIREANIHFEVAPSLCGLK